MDTQERQAVTIYLPPAIIAELDSIAKQQMISRTATIRLLLQKGVADSREGVGKTT